MVTAENLVFDLNKRMDCCRRSFEEYRTVVDLTREELVCYYHARALIYTAFGNATYLMGASQKDRIRFRRKAEKSEKMLEKLRASEEIYA